MKKGKKDNKVQSSSSSEEEEDTNISVKLEVSDVESMDDESPDYYPDASDQSEDDSSSKEDASSPDIRLIGQSIQGILDLSTESFYTDTYILTMDQSVVGVPKLLLHLGSKFFRTIFDSCFYETNYIMLPDFDKNAVEDCIEYLTKGEIQSTSKERFQGLVDLLELFRIPFEPMEKKKGSICKECGKVLRDKYTLKNHMTVMHINPPKKVDKKKEFICDHCGRVLKDKYSLKNHISVMHVNTERNVECPVCFKKFKTKWNLKSHSTVHEGKKFICETCGLQTKTKMALALHLETHADVRRFKCESCPKSFSVKTYLTYHHLTAHSDERPFKCEECGNAFKMERQLRYHRRVVHESVKSIHCLICSYSCSNMPKMSQHLIIHSGTKPYHCSHCSETFKHKEEGRRHAKAKHGNAPVTMKFIMNEAIKKLTETSVKFTNDSQEERESNNE